MGVSGGPTAMDVVDSIQDELSSESVSTNQDEVDGAITVIKAGGLSIAPVKMTSELGQDGQKKVPGIKIIGLSSELKKAISGEGEDSKDTSIDDEEEEEDEDDEDAEEEEDEDEDDEEGEDDQEEDEDEEEEDDVEPPPKVVKTPKVTIRKVQQVVTPGSGEANETPKKMPFAGALAVSTGKKRGRPSRADLAQREQERQEAIARGEPDPELKRKRRKPLKLNDAESEEDSKEVRKRRKREEREERRKAKAKSEDTEDTDVEEKPKKKGRKKKILT